MFSFPGVRVTECCHSVCRNWGDLMSSLRPESWNSSRGYRVVEV